MGNKIFKLIIDEQIKIFKNSFSQTAHSIFWDENLKKLIHPGEYGMYREDIVKDFLRILIPERLDVDDGFIITNDDKVSTQCDIIIYDKLSTPVLKINSKQRFFTSETVVGIGEIKSTLDKKTLGETLNKLAKNKSLRKIGENKSFIFKDNGVNHLNSNDPRNHIFTFLICNKLNFKLDRFSKDIDDLYEPDIPYENRHNMILSLEDGILLYYDKIKRIHYPIIGNKKHENIFDPIQKDEIQHIKVFAHFLYMATSSSTIFYPDLVLYMD